MTDIGEQPAESQPEWKAGDRVWLLPDADKREVKSEQPGVVIRVLPTGRVRVAYVEFSCKLAKTVEPKRIRHRNIMCRELKETA